MLANRLTLHERASLRLKLRLRLPIAPAHRRAPILGLLERDALPRAGRAGGVRRPDGRARELERVRVARADEGEPVRDELRGERLVRGALRLEHRRAVRARGRAEEHHPVLRRVRRRVRVRGRHGLVVAVGEGLVALRRGYADDLPL